MKRLVNSVSAEDKLVCHSKKSPLYLDPVGGKRVNYGKGNTAQLKLRRFAEIALLFNYPVLPYKKRG